ncbi:hypothetical protein EAH76_14670 [Sphingomonas glacialis]|uniref:Uncharacterized protein n=1 Tax=Sphingomonas glacialis TaxID=658225 RepID=A0A502FRA1_9SPHN|nr:hypothetical protein EAH76_14670 [Sphingomonas glacialis]
MSCFGRPLRNLIVEDVRYDARLKKAKDLRRAGNAIWIMPECHLIEQLASPRGTRRLTLGTSTAAGGPTTLAP